MRAQVNRAAARLGSARKGFTSHYGGAEGVQWAVEEVAGGRPANYRSARNVRELDGWLMQRQPNDDLAAFMTEAGYSNKALARDVRDEARARGEEARCTHVDVARWLDGTKPRGKKPAYIAAALSRRLGRLVSPADVGMATVGESSGLDLTFADTRTDVLRRVRVLASLDLSGNGQVQRSVVPTAALVAPMASWLVAPPAELAASVTASPRVGQCDVEAVYTTLRMFELLDHEYGGGHARLAAVQYLRTTIGPLLAATYSAGIGQSLFAVAAQFTYKTGAMAYDIGMHGLARRYFVQALNLAHLSGDRALGGKVLALMGHQANFLGDYRQAVDLARAAKVGAKGHATPTVHAMYCAMEGRALASLGDERACARALSEAEHAFEHSGTAVEPDWIAYFDQAELYDEFAHCFAALRRTEDATKYANMALTYARDNNYRRSRTFCQLTLAQAQILAVDSRRRDVDKACHIAADSLPELEQLKSSRVRAYIGTLDRLLEPYAQVRSVVDLREQMARPQLST